MHPPRQADSTSDDSGAEIASGAPGIVFPGKYLRAAAAQPRRPRQTHDQKTPLNAAIAEASSSERLRRARPTATASPGRDARGQTGFAPHQAFAAAGSRLDASDTHLRPSEYLQFDVQQRSDCGNAVQAGAALCPLLVVVATRLGPLLIAAKLLEGTSQTLGLR